MSALFHFLSSITLIGGLSILASSDRTNIRIHCILRLLIIELLLAWIFLNSSIGQGVIVRFVKFFNYLLIHAAVGTNFVFGGMMDANLATFFLHVLCSIIFVSALIGILQYTKLLPLIIKIIGTLLSKINGMGKLESFNTISSLILGQSENFITYKDILSQISPHRMYTMVVTAMSTVSMAIIGTYMGMLDPKYIVAALILNMFSTFIIISLINPYQVKEEDDIHLSYIHNKQSFFEMLSEYILTGFKVALIVTAMLIGFIAIIAGINAIFSAVIGISFQDCLGYGFYPLAWILGVPAKEAPKVASIMATKLVFNEFVAMSYLKQVATELSPHSIGISSVFLVSFANFSSIGIITGAIKSLDEKQGNVVSSFGLRLLYGSTLVSFLSAAITSLVLK